LQASHGFHFLAAALALRQVLFQLMGPVVGQLTVDGQDDDFLCHFAIHDVFSASLPQNVLLFDSIDVQIVRLD
jgi:hypothetical protein